MGLLDELKGFLGQQGAGTSSPDDVAAAFHQMASSADQSTLSSGLAEAFRSDQTPPFSQMVSQLFTNGSPDQRAGMLNALLGAAPSNLQSSLSSLIPGLAAGGTLGALTGAQASALTPDQVSNLANQVHQNNPGVIEHMSSFYAQHPTLVKTLGSVAMMVAMRKIAERHT